MSQINAVQAPPRTDRRAACTHVTPLMLALADERRTNARDGTTYRSLVSFTEAECAALRDKLDTLHARSATYEDRIILASIIAKLDADACVVAQCRTTDARRARGFVPATRDALGGRA